MYKLLPFLFSVLLTINSLQSFTQVNINGLHLSDNYTREEYNAAPQNWAIVQDKRGVIYVGNEGKILEYDGKNWRGIPNNNGSLIRSLAVDSSGTIYAGGVGEFGYLKPDKTGNLEYRLLSSQIDSSFKDVWKTYTRGDTVYFCTRHYIFQYKQDSLLNTIEFSKWHFLDFMVDGQLYLGDYNKGLMQIKNNKPVVIKGGRFYSKKDIFVILPFKNNKLLIGLQKHGFFIYDPETGRSMPISSLGEQFDELNQYTEYLYNGIQLDDGNYAFATLDNGLIIVNGQTGNIAYHYNENNGLQDPTVIYPYQSMNGHLWLGLNRGITKLEYNSPLKHFDKNSGYKGFPLDVIRFRDKLFVATNLGVFQQASDNQGFPDFKSVLNINNLAWSFLRVSFDDGKNDRLLAGTHQGIFDITDPTHPIQLDEELDNIFKANVLIQSTYHTGRIYAGYTGGVVEFTYTSRGWVKTDQDQDMTANISFLAEENDSTLWAASELSGIFKVVNLDKSYRYDTSKGLPSNDFNRVFHVKDNNYFTTKKGFYKYNKEQDLFEPHNLFSDGYNNTHLRYFKQYGDNAYWIIYSDSEGVERIEKIIQNGNDYTFVTTPFKRLGDATFYNFYNDDKDLTWFTTAEGLYIYNNTFDKNYSSIYHALIRKVTQGTDSVLFNGTYYTNTSEYHISASQPEYLKSRLDFRHNDLSFHFSAPYFEQEDAMQYSYILEGYDTEWSNWSPSEDKGYTNLDEKDYTFRVKARNIYGVESQVAEYSFKVLPPWYRTAWAYIGYFIAGIGLVVLIVKLYTRRLEQEKIRLEKIVQQRTREVVQQKEKIENQRDEIAKKNKDITDSIEYASKIQNAVLPAEDITEQILSDHFILFRPRDIVSGDFYWINKKNGLLFVIAADCTGHGVPGAFMSMLGVSLLNEIVNKHQVTQANQVLNELRHEVKRTLKQTGKEGEAKDGMDIALTMIDPVKMKMQYAGAYNPLFLFRDGELIQYKADRMPIGIYVMEKESFTNHEIDLQKGDTFYVFSDGYQDQFGGEDGRKFKTKRLKQLLTDIHQKPMEEQREILDRTLDEWRGDYSQLDDIIMIGVRV